MPFFIKKPEVIEAVLWTGENVKDIKHLLGDELKYVFYDIHFSNWHIRVISGVDLLRRGMWLVSSSQTGFSVMSEEKLKNLYNQTPENPKEDKPNNQMELF